MTTPLPALRRYLCALRRFPAFVLAWAALAVGGVCWLVVELLPELEEA